MLDECCLLVFGSILDGNRMNVGKSEMKVEESWMLVLKFGIEQK